MAVKCDDPDGPSLLGEQCCYSSTIMESHVGRIEHKSVLLSQRAVSEAQPSEMIYLETIQIEDLLEDSTD